MHKTAIIALPIIVFAMRAGAQGPTRAASGQPIDGITCQGMEGNGLHIHQHLVILDRGKPVPVPENVGHVMSKGCLYWLHTHTPDGIIHVESPTRRTFLLGEFFDIWGQPLSRTTAATARAGKNQRLRVWVNGKPYKGDPRAIKLEAHSDIVIEAGPPFPTPPRFTSWGSL